MQDFYIKMKRLKPEAKMPTYAHPGDVGMDLYSLESCILKPGERRIFFVGFALEFPEGYGAFVMDKSSTSKAGLKTMGGVFDAGYRGEYNVGLINLSEVDYVIERGDKLAQLVFLPVMITNPVEVDELNTTSRGTGSFGSTGKK